MLTRARAVLLLVVLGVAALASAGPTWVQAQTMTAIDPALTVAVTGGDAAPAVSAAGFVIVAAGLALALVGRRARWVVLVVVAAAGVLVATTAVAVALSPEAAATAGAGAVAGVTDLTAPPVVTLWPWLSAVLGALVVLAAVVTAVLARGWSTASARHDRTGRAAQPGPRDARVGADVPGEANPDGAVDPHDAWDAQTQGADPSAPQDR